MEFIHLHVHSPYSLLDGGSSIEALVRAAAGFGMGALALTDHNSVAGAVKFASACAAHGIRPLFGAEVTLEDESHLTLIARDRTGYANLCRLLSIAFSQGDRLTPRLPWIHLPRHAEGLFCLSGCRLGRIPALLRRHLYTEARDEAEKLRGWFGDRFYVELQQDYVPQAARVARDLAELADWMDVGVVATNNVHYATPDDAVAHEVLRCIADLSTVDHVALGRPLNDQRYLKPACEMAELFRWRPDALQNTLAIANRCNVPLGAIRGGEDVTPVYSIPAEFPTAAAYLRHLVLQGAADRYGRLTPHAIRNTQYARLLPRIDHELAVIEELGFVDYFLMVWSVVQWARAQGIRATGRGSAADSCVAYCLYLTDVDVMREGGYDLPFARFLCEGKLPDIDVDFPSDRRDEVFQHVLDAYGEENVAMVCTFATFRAKSAVRDVGKALGLPEEALKFLSDHLSHFMSAAKLREAFDGQAELRPYRELKERFDLLFDLCARIANFPRHIATHSSGIVISRMAIDTLAPLQRSAKGLVRIMQLDKDDAEDLGLIKFDILALRILSAVADTESDVSRRDPAFSYDAIPFDDPRTFAMLRAGMAVGVFQLESPAQMALATTLNYSVFRDLVDAVALIRPGPVKGNGVGRYVAVRNGWMRAEYLHPSLVPILKRTFGCVVFQEQVLSIVAVMTGCTEAAADRFRKSLSKHVRDDTMEEARNWFVRTSLARHPDLSPSRAHRMFDQIQAWSGYGFTEGHAQSFALTAWKTAYLTDRHPAEYFAALMSNQPMGYYSANSLAAEARHRGVAVLPVDVNRSDDKCRAVRRPEPGPNGAPPEPAEAVVPEEAIRLGLRLVAELRAADIEAILAARAKGRFTSLLDFCVRVPLHYNRLENLVLCGAFDGLHDHRRGLQWRLEETVGLALSYRAASDAAPAGAPYPEGASPVPTRWLEHPRLDYGPHTEVETPVAWDIPDFSEWEKFMWTWRIVGVTAEAHVFSHLRERLAARRIITADEAMRQPARTRVTVAGLNVRPHRPPTKSGQPVLFTSLEDETGMLQLVCSGAAIDTCTATFLTAPVVIVRGIVTRRGRGVMLQVERAKPLLMRDFSAPGDDARIQPLDPPATRSYPGTKLVAAPVG